MKNDRPDFYTHIPPLEAKIDNLCALLRNEQRLALVSIDTQNLLELQDVFDRSMYETALGAVQRCFSGLCGSELRKDDLIVSNITSGKKFYIFLSKAREGRRTEIADLEKIAFRLQEYIYGRLFRIFFPLTQHRPAVRVGYNLAFHSSGLNDKSVLQNVIEDAENMAPYLDLKYGLIRKTLIQDVLREQSLDVKFKPLFLMDSGAVMGYETAVRAAASGFSSAGENLMHYARETGFSRELDWLGRMQVLTVAGGVDRDKYLFFKTAPEIGMEPLQRSREFREKLEKLGLRPDRIVFEIDEHQLLFDRNLLPSVIHKYPDLQFLAEINAVWMESDFGAFQDERIHFIRITSELTHHLPDYEEYRKGLCRLSDFTRNSGKLLIVDNIRNEAECDLARRCGADIGGGDYFNKTGVGGEVLAPPAAFLADPALQNRLLLSIYMKRGREYINREDYDKAVLEFSKAIEIDPDNREAYYYRGFSFCEEGVYTVAQKDMAKLKELEPADPKILLLEARLAERRGDLDRATALYTDFIDLSSRSLDSEVTFARLRLKMLTRRG